MGNSSYVSLHTHSEGSLLDSVARVDDLAEEAARLNMFALGLSDHGSMYQIIPFYKACKKNGVKPILGAELYVSGRTRFDKENEDRENYHLTVFAQNQEGYRNLMKLVSAGHLEGFYYKMRVDHELLERYNRGLIILSGCLGGELAQSILKQDSKASEILDFYKQVFGDRYYLEVQNHGIDEQLVVNDWLFRQNVPIVATNDSHYVHTEDATHHDIFLCMQTAAKVNAEKRFRFQGEEFYLKPTLDLPVETLQNSIEIAKRCNVDIDLGNYTLPPFEIPDRYLNADAYLVNLSYRGLEDRYSILNKELVDRLDEELFVIQQTNFATYFLIVWDIYRFAKEQGIIAGPGRGSAAGSLVAYCLGITNVDPIKHGLLFERFLNKERISMPDVDCDFSVAGREKIINYVKEKYGNVSQICTFSTLQSKAAIADVGRALDVPLKETTRLTKLIPVQYGRNRSVKECRETIPEFVTDSNLLDIAEKVEGLVKGIGTHAAGVVIAPDDILNYTPLQYAQNKTTIITQYDMDALQEIGLLKMDFLGLENLDVIETCLSLIGHDVEIAENDSKTYEMISRAFTTGVFQIGTSGFKSVLKEMKPSTFNDLVVLVALFRPGPMQYIGQYINRKFGREEVTYPHPLLEEILKDTYGLMIYQEQVMKAAQKLAGFSLSEADRLRAAMGKKDRDKMAALKEQFLEGCLKNNIDQKFAVKLFDDISKFADYSFNLAHATSYAMTVYKTAYLKANYPLQYLTALFTHSKDLEEIAEIYRDCKELGIEVLRPDISLSLPDFTIEGNAIRFGLAKIKNVGRGVAELIERSRVGIWMNNDCWVSRSDFCESMKRYKEVNIKAIMSLVNAGALDAFGDRNSMLYALDYVFAGNSDPKLEMPKMTEEEIGLREKEYLGVHLTNHPLKSVKQLDNTIKDMVDLSSVTIAAYINGVRKIETRNKKQMAYLQLEDLTGTCEAVVFPQTFNKVHKFLETGRVLKVSGTVETNQLSEDSKLQLIVRELGAIND